MMSFLYCFLTSKGHPTSTQLKRVRDTHNPIERVVVTEISISSDIDQRHIVDQSVRIKSAISASIIV